MTTTVTRAAVEKATGSAHRARGPLRALLIGAVMTVAGAYWAFYVYNIAMGDSWTGASLFRGPLFVLFCLVLVNLALRALRPRLMLDQRELLIIYTMVAIGAGMNGVGALAFLTPAIASIYHYNAAFGFERLMPYVPQHLVIHDPKVIQAFHTGHATLWSAPVLREWATPVLWWSALILALVFTVLCIQVLMRKQWLHNERLAFPLAYVPLAITEGAGDLVRGSRLFWVGFGALAALHFANGLTMYFPALPHIPLRGSTLEMLKRNWPWSVMGGVHIAYDPFIIGIAYLVNLDVSLSVWLFYVLFKVTELMLVLRGWRDPAAGRSGIGRYPLMDEQGVGAFIGLALMVVWMGRRRLLEAVRIGLRGWHRDEGEMVSARSAVLGVAIGCVFMLWFMTWMGLALAVAAPVLALMLIFCVIMSRVVAESGYAYFTPENGAGETVLFALGTRATPMRDQSGLAWLSTVDQFYSDSPTPQQLNGMKLAEVSGMRPRHLLAAVVAGAVIGLIASWAAQLTMYYHYGAASGKIREWWPRMGYHTFRFAKGYYDPPRPPDWMMMQGVGFGVVFVILLAKLRSLFYWFPLHPAGYLICGTPAARFIWVPFLLGWLLKLMVVRYGGLRLYRRLLPFVLGVIVGDNVAPALWSAYGALTGGPPYTGK